MSAQTPVFHSVRSSEGRSVSLIDDNFFSDQSQNCVSGIVASSTYTLTNKATTYTVNCTVE